MRTTGPYFREHVGIADGCMCGGWDLRLDDITFMQHLEYMVLAATGAIS